MTEGSQADPAETNDLSADLSAAFDETTESTESTDTGKPDVSEAARTLAAARKTGEDTAGTDTVAAAADTVTGAQAAEILEAPQHWPAQARELFAKQPKEVQSWVLERHKAMEADYTRKMQDLSGTRRVKEQLDEIFGPMRDELYRNGLDEITAVRELVGWHNYVQQKPVEAFQRLAQRYGIDLAQLASGNGQQAQLPPEFNQVSQRVSQIDQQLRSYLSAQQDQQFRANLSQIEQFAQEKDAQGQLLRPYFDEVSADVADLIRAAKARGLEMTLQEAHDRAIYANPQVRAKVLAAQDAQRRVKDEAERKAKADAARKAAAGNVTGQGAATKVVANTDSIGADLRAAFDAAEGRV